MKFSDIQASASRISKRFLITTAVAASLLGLNIPSAQSALTGKGLIHPINHFPTWFSDANGVTLQLCLDGDGATGMCFYDPVIPGNPTSQATGFGAEAFWWAADARLDLAGGGQAILVLGLEAAYGAGDPAPNDQFAFGRIRLRADVPADGEYKIWHPFLNEATGCLPEVYQATAGTKAINVTRDIGGGTPFETMLSGEVGPFLIWDPAIAPAAPTGYVGDPNIEHAVVGGHCNINYFRIEGPAGVDLDGNGNNAVQTNLFSVQGKIFDESNTPPGIESVRVSYFRSTNNNTGVTTSRINTWAKAPPHASVKLLNPQSHQNTPMVFDGESTFFKRIALNAANSNPMPAQLTVTALSAGGLSTTQDIRLVDQVDIQLATWAAAAQTLRVVALSSDKIALNSGAIPELTLRVGADTFPMPQSGAVGRYEVILTGIAVPPAHVTVTSSKGGSATQAIAD
ncbi:hypothetical protein ABF87_04640 [Nitrosomonas sp. JL21]|uniref:hypothetical protein n=1 Tax=Nitrosomonas sp. JL21 TaxID=153949 RepID=UPI00136A335C|nr:hypothetical protein [Nitrosomonas sp. JL21]MBL8498166.1 hypothetical protein [Nitrosomonas sp.]MXS77257.1 hypothetical protein [Nitrosomonas sp. JL21]